MSEVAPERLAFGTVAALFQSPQAAGAAADTLVYQGYPRELVTVLTGRPWSSDGATGGRLQPDPELRFQLVPVEPSDRGQTGDGAIDPRLAAFTGDLLTARARRRNPALWPVVTLGLGVVATLIALYRGNWIDVTIVSLVAFHVVVIALVLAYARGHQQTFPFRQRISAVEEALEHGGALVTVQCTLPYTRWVEETLARVGGEILGYAPEVVYPVPA